MSEIGIKIFTTQLFFTDHLKHKIIDERTCKTPLVGELSYYYHLFFKLSGFPEFFGKVFLMTLKFFSLDFLQEQYI